MAIANLSPNDRIAIVGKTGCGKTQQATVLAFEFARVLHSPWEVWWLDTKNDPSDLKNLRSWGACNGANEKDRQRPGGLRNFLYFKIDESNGYSVVEQAQAKCQEAYERGHVIVVIDEYTQVVPSDRTPGYGLKNIFARGRGKKVGLIGLTQEPVNVPRMLLSQASHLCLFTVTYPYDIKYLRSLCKDYVPPADQGDTHGFYWSHTDGSAKWAYYPSQKDWYDNLNFALTKEKPTAE
jgi:hypothetical protein